MKRDLYTEDHDQYRDTVREFIEREVAPNILRWDEEHWIDRDVFRKAAEVGIYALQIPEQYGGAGEPDFRYRMVVCEELAAAGANALGTTLAVQDDLILAYLTDLTNEEQRERWLPGVAAGTTIGALAMTEPGAGSDLRGIRTRARRDGDDWIIDGQKTFISSGIMADLAVVAVQTDPEAGSHGFSLFGVASNTPGFVRGRQLDKIGLASQDTAELFFDSARVPAADMIGEEGMGLQYMMSHLPRERLGVSAKAMATAQAVFAITVNYTKERKAFGGSLSNLQHVRFELAEMSTELDVAQAYIDRCVVLYNEGQLTAVDAAKAKWYITELQKRVVDRCLQLHGGYGYMREYAVGRAFIDTRIETIYAGTTETMKDLIGKDLLR
jgi:alkylation response protein AidB-like acyl-CoA dehydrogenase